VVLHRPNGQSHGAYHLRSLRQLIDRQNPASIQQDFAFVQEHAIICGLGDYGQFVREAITRAEASPSAQPSLAEALPSAQESTP
jgi:hypothetical protein